MVDSLHAELFACLLYLKSTDLFSSKVAFSKLPSEWQTVWIRIRLNIFSDIIFVHKVFANVIS